MAIRLVFCLGAALACLLAGCGDSNTNLNDTYDSPMPTSRIPVLPTATPDYSPTSTPAPTPTTMPESQMRLFVGRRLYQEGRVQEAIKQYDISIRLDPAFDEVYNDRGAAYMTLGLYEQAIKDFDTAIGMEPEAGGFYANRAMAYTLSGMSEAAKRDIDKAASLGIDREELMEFINAIKGGG